MYLKSLGLEGFKSFVDKTEMYFTPGFTAIVGPNGCGKSNVSDAIRWVIGEQSSKSLRGTRITDLIFNGTGSRKPVNRAEISLTLSNVPEGLRIANIPNLAEEIRVTRCYHRSGESEFYINQVPCRLKDITDFLLDVGISPKVLSVIEQGHIQDIITSKPETRRILIEEAAGILKYKHRRNEALRKLEASQQNLDRITDIVQELARHVESLKRQAAKAERYKLYRTEVKDLSLQIFSRKVKHYQVELKKIEAALQVNHEQKAQWTAQASTLDNTITQLHLEIDELIRTVNEKKEDIHSISARMAGDEHAIELKQSNITRAEADIQTADHEIGRMNGEIESLTLETQAQRKELGDLSERINEQGFALEREREARDAARRALSQAENQAREGEAELLAVHQQISQKKNKQTALDTRKQYLADRDLKLEEEQGALRSQLQGLTDQVGLQEEEFGHGQSLLSAAKNERDGLRQQVKEGREKLEALNEAAALVKEDYLAQSSVRTSLVELRRKFEGFQSGVRHLMAGPENGERLPGLREVLVDVLKTPAEYEAAIEAVLGEQLQTIIVDSYSDTVGAIGYLREHQAGRGTFLPVQHKPVSVTTLHLNGNPGVLGKAMDLIECREEYRPVVELLLDSVAVVRDLESAIQLHENPEFHGTVVTQSGEIIDPRGMVTGGAGDNSPGLLAQNRKIEELTARVQVLQGEVESAQNMAGEQKGRVLAWENQLQQIDQDVNARTLTLANAEKDLQQARREIARLGERLSSLDQERTQGAQEVDGLAQQLEMLAAELSEVEAEKARRESGLEGLRSQVEEVRRGLETLSGEIGRIEVLAASLKGKRDNTLTEIKRIELQQENLRHRIQKHDREKTENAARIQSAQEEIRVLEQKILGQAREKDQLSEEVVQEEEALREKEDSLKSMEQETRALARQIQELTEAMSRVELRRSEIKLQITHLEERAFEEFNVILADVIAACANELNEEETREAEERVRELKDKIARMGEVNLAALSEFQQADERYQFLKRQQEDLAESIHLLHETIERINRTTRDRFLETFEKVSTNFKEVFARLFQGGKAELILTDPANPLESGIEISANPMGKIMQNLSLLSGGEKAMTAIALMFSVFKVRPSPFCLLDEVDAPLDEANVIRFQEMLKEMSDKTQFIIITHNQKTMSFADVLYGITMEEKGVSKAVSVTLN